MTLSFKTKWPNGEPTYFIFKILAGLTLYFSVNDLHDRIIKIVGTTDKDKLKQLYSIPPDLNRVKPKLHTIREDKKNRWKPGKKIHFVINNRTKNRFQFAPVIPVVSTQKIQIIPNSYEGLYDIFIDNKLLSVDQMITFAINDGFESFNDFENYFNKPFSGKIIHWTNHKY